MASQPGFDVGDPTLLAEPRNAALVHEDPGVFPPQPYLIPEADVFGTTVKNTKNKPAPARVGRAGFVSQGAAAGVDFFEHMHVIPRRFDFGFILATQLADIEVYNAYRRDDRSWDAFTNNAGAGVTLIGEPSLPATVPAQGGIQMQLQVTTQGPALVDTTLDFEFDVSTILVPIGIERVVLFAIRPENEYDEFLEWFTDVMRAKAGAEQRPSPRENPRQFFEFEYFFDDGTERSTFENFLFDWQSRVFGVPVWHEEEPLTQAATAGDSTIFVGSTDYADFRVGGLVAVFQDRSAFDIIPINTINPTSLVLENSLLHSYPIGTAVLPLRTAHVRSEIGGGRFLNNASRMKLVFRVLDNDADLADLSAFSSFNGRLLYDGYVFEVAGLSDRAARQITVIDNETGVVYQDSAWDHNRRVSGFGAIVRGKQAMWEHRQMLHAIRGQQVAWYLPTNRDDIVPVLDLDSGSSALDIENQGYAQFVRDRQHRNVIRVTFNNGDQSLMRTIIGSVEVDDTRETLTLDGTWPATYTPAEVDRIEFVEKLRFDTDRIRIRHGGAGAQTARITAPVRTVFN